MTRMVVVIVLLGLWCGSGFAQGQPPAPTPKAPAPGSPTTPGARPPGQPRPSRDAFTPAEVTSIGYCKGQFTLTFKNGSKSEFDERRLRVGFNSGPQGPKPGTAGAMVSPRDPTRGFLIFSGPDDVKDLVKKTC